MDLSVHVPIFFSEEDRAFAELVGQSLQAVLPKITFPLEVVSSGEFREAEDVSGPRIVILSSRSYRGVGKNRSQISGAMWRIREILFITQDSIPLPINSGMHFPFMEGMLDLEFRISALSTSVMELSIKSEPDEERAAVLGGSLVRLSSGMTINPSLFIRLDDIEFSVRTSNCLRNENATYIGDLLQYSSPELLRMPNFGRKSLNEVREVLAGMNLYLGAPISVWPPNDIDERAAKVALARRITGMRPARLGIKFQPRLDFLVIDPSGEESDKAAAAKSLVKQLHHELERKITTLVPLSPRLDNQIGWRGVDELFSRLSDLLHRETSGIPDVLGLLYSSALELGSFLEMDSHLRERDDSFAAPLDPEFRRPMEDFLRTFAPWLRNFPTIREADDEAGQFLSKSTQVNSASAVIRVASNTRLIQKQDADLLSGLLEAQVRGEFQGVKAGHRGVLSVHNLIVAAAGIIGSIMIGAVGSDLSTKSYLAEKAGSFLASAESSIIEVTSEFPIDLQLAIEAVLREIDRSPFVSPTRPEPVRVDEPSPSDRRRARGDSNF